MSAFVFPLAVIAIASHSRTLYKVRLQWESKLLSALTSYESGQAGQLHIIARSCSREDEAVVGAILSAYCNIEDGGFWLTFSHLLFVVHVNRTPCD